jgi:hypothetical protein
VTEISRTVGEKVEHLTEIIKLLEAVQRQCFAHKVCRQFLTREL